MTNRTYRVTEIVGTSPDGIDQAIRNGIERAGQTLLQAGLEAGVALPFSCTMGGCGACKLLKREGTLVMSEPNCLSDSEREAGYVLACCAYAASDVVIADH